MVEFDAFLVTHLATTKVDVQDLSEKIIGKRKCGGKIETPIKRRVYPAYFLPDLARIVALADERIPFMSLSEQLSKRGVVYSDVEIQEKAVGLVLKIVKFPNAVSPLMTMQLQKYLLSASVRMQQRVGRIWRVEYVFLGNPVSSLQDAKNARQTLIFSYDIGPDSVDKIVKEWTQIVHLFAAVDQLEKYMEAVDLGNICADQELLLRQTGFGIRPQQAVLGQSDVGRGQVALQPGCSAA